MPRLYIQPVEEDGIYEVKNKGVSGAIVGGIAAADDDVDLGVGGLLGMMIAGTPAALIYNNLKIAHLRKISVSYLEHSDTLDDKLKMLKESIGKSSLYSGLFKFFDKDWFNLSDVTGKGGNWSIGDNYLSHPLYPDHGYLIEEKSYKDYILREMVSEIAGFIMGNFALEYIAVGLIDSSEINSGATVPAKSLNAEASFNCSIASSYSFTAKNTNKGNYDENDYMGWIKKFPDIITAVNHNAQKLEVTKSTSVALNIDFAVTGKVGIGGKGATNTEFYIAYKRK